MRFEVASGNRYYQSVNGLLLTKDGKVLVAVPAGLQNPSIPNGVEIIGNAAAVDCEKIKALDFPLSLKQIQGHAFDRCSSLERVTIPEGVEIIGAEAFARCPKLKRIDLPSSVRRLASGAFRESGVTNVFLSGSIANIGEGAFC